MLKREFEFFVEQLEKRELLTASAFSDSPMSNVAWEDDMLFINVNQKTRALEFLAKRGDGARLVQFQIKPEFLDSLRRLAVDQRVGRQFPGRPQLVDPTRAPDQFGIPSNMFDELLENIIPGTGGGF